MKKTNFLYASVIMMACAFGIQSCTVEDNPAPQPVQEPEPVIVEETFIYDFEAAFNAGENPTKFNGNQNNGQGFYGWEKAEKTDSKRNDYKGYEWAEGSVLPEVCHVWRRTDHINGNIKNGGLYCPNDREFAIDGLLEGALVQITYDPGVKEEKEDEVTNLLDVPFQAWTAFVNGDPTGVSGRFESHINEAVAGGGAAYGDGAVIDYADLSAYEKLIITTSAGTARMLFNRDIDNGQCSGTESESHLIDNTNAECMTWASKYFKNDTVENNVIITVDLALMVKEKGYAHLHVIKANWGQDLVLTSATLVSKKTVVTPLDSKLLWAIGDGSSTEGLGVRATAEIDGVEAVPGQTEIASEANIRVKTITPADNGTGYIVVKVKKGMIIKKIVITNFIEQKDE